MSMAEAKRALRSIEMRLVEAKRTLRRLRRDEAPAEQIEFAYEQVRILKSSASELSGRLYREIEKGKRKKR